MSPAAVIAGGATLYLAFAFALGWLLGRRSDQAPMTGQCPECRERDGLHDTTCLSYRSRERRP